jgi:cholesterol transport system auxiliary component
MSVRKADVSSLNRIAARAGLVAVIVLASACSVLPRPEPVDTYLLPGAPASRMAAQGQEEQALPVSLRVSRPVAGTQLSGQRILVVPDANRVSVYKGANWSEPVPVLLRDRIVEAFRSDGRIAALSSDEQRLQADYEIASELLAFHSEYRDGAPEVVVRLDARLVQRDGRRIVASRLFEARQRPAGVAVPQVVAGFGEVSTAVTGALVDWAVGEIARCLPKACAD